MRDFSAMPEAMRPQPIAAMPGCSAWCSFSAVRQISEATAFASSAEILSGLLRGNAFMIEEAAPRLIMNPDGSRWSGNVDDLPLPLLEMGRVLGDAVHRRLFGSPLEMEDSDDE